MRRKIAFVDDDVSILESLKWIFRDEPYQLFAFQSPKEALQKIEEEDPKEYSLAVILFHRAEVLEEKGEIEEALAFYKRVQEEFPQAYYSFDASQKIKELEAKN